MSLCWGDTWTNMIQPSKALPSLGIAKLGVRILWDVCNGILWTGFIILASILMWTYLF